MSNDMTLFDQQQLPAHLQNMFGDESNIEAGAKINALSIRGKVFRIVFEGEEKAITKYNEETGDREPVSTVNVIVLNQGPFGARVLHTGPYSADSNDGPKCFSLDGKTPDPAAAEPQARTCAECPHSVKGSKVTPNGTLTTACSLQRRLAVVPAHKPDFAPLLLRLAATSAYDPDTKGAENGWMAWRQYLDFLNARGVRHTAQLVTKLRFDPNAEHPKLLFKAERFINEDEAKTVAASMKSEDVQKMLFADPDAAPPEPVAEPAAVDPKPAKPAEPAKPAADTEEAEDWGEEEAPKPKPKKKKVAKKKVAKKPAVEDDDDDELERKTVSAGKSTPEPEQTGSAVDSLLDDWDA